MRHSGTGATRSVLRRRPAPLSIAVAIVLVLATGCGKSEFRYVANSSINTYLKVPSGWQVYDHDDLVEAEVASARQANQPPSLIDVLISRQFQWRVAYDGDPKPSVQHTLGVAEEPVVEVSVRALDADEHDIVSLAALRNVIVNYDDMKARAQSEASGQGVGVSGPSTTTFRPIDEEELHYPGGVRGVRLRYVLRSSPATPFYAFDQTTLVDSKSERLYVLLIRSSEARFLQQNELFSEIARSFTVKPKG